MGLAAQLGFMAIGISGDFIGIQFIFTLYSVGFLARGGGGHGLRADSA
eukprot:CAMPEP_0175736550 /NCGR_PEP_ID=MMETSP0097-20121207/53485_1 /TAXON_ID=311494 /ORGANISM="Alexandrium monilatum, Strain CCMP3105" /LENGTH=47 /DNA_ID= /DNA_START= /DNA_END= /DNA_ORIENTATION=